MPYDPSDLRTQLVNAGPATGVPREVSCRELGNSAADEVHPHGSLTWWTRSQALVIAYTEARPGDDLVVDGVEGESVVLVLDGAEVSVDHSSGDEVVSEPAVVIVPPGPRRSACSAEARSFAWSPPRTAPTLAARCSNSDEYSEPDGNVAEFIAWPDPPAGGE